MPALFRFRLETVLRVRELREREARRKVGAKLAEIAALDRLNEQTAGEIAARQSVLLESQIAATVNPREMAGGRAWVGYLRRTMGERYSARTALRAELDALREELRTARTQTRVLGKLRERRHAEWKRVAGLREQVESDDLARQLLGFSGVADEPREGL